MLSMLCIGFVSCISFFMIQVEGGSLNPHLHLIIDCTDAQTPKRLRTTLDPLPDRIPLEGLRSLNASGSGQFSVESLFRVIKKVPFEPSEIVIMDLREESHGFINKQAISWTDRVHNSANRGRSIAEIEADEAKRLDVVYETGRVVLGKKESESLEEWSVDSAQTEREVLESLGFSYVRLPVTDHHRPINEVVDLFVQTILTLPENKWIHFHCRGGAGRTSTFFTLYDIMMNCDRVPLEDILCRQNALGGKDLTDSNPTSYKYRMAMERLEFVKLFHQYCMENPGYAISWSEWFHASNNLTKS